MFKALRLPVLSICWVLASCQSVDQDPHSLPFDYDYAGILPCADCLGILVHIGFDTPRSGSFWGQYRRVYQGTINGNHIESEEVLIRLDSNWVGTDTNEPMVVLILNPEDSALRSIYHWQEDQIELLDRNGEKIKSNLNYTLERQLLEGI